jgi:hypothetical protein
VIETAEVPRSSAMLLDIKLRRRRGHRLVPAADAGGMTELALGATSWRSVSSGGPRQGAVTAHAGIAAEWDVVCEKAKSSKDLAAVIGKVAPLVQQRVHRTIHQLWTQPSGVIATSAMSLPASRGPLAATRAAPRHADTRPAPTRYRDIDHDLQPDSRECRGRRGRRGPCDGPCGFEVAVRRNLVAVRAGRPGGGYRSPALIASYRAGGSAARALAAHHPFVPPKQ